MASKGLTLETPNGGSALFAKEDDGSENKNGTSTLSTKEWLLKLHAKGEFEPVASMNSALKSPTAISRAICCLALGFFTLDSVHNILANAKKNQELEKSPPGSSRSRRGGFRVQPQKVKTFTNAVAKQSPMGEQQHSQPLSRTGSVHPVHRSPFSRSL